MRSAISASNLSGSSRGRPRRLIAALAITVALALLAIAAHASTADAASTFYVRGGGNGHGIGMSQYGSYGYALHGKRYRWILAHYYQGTSIGHVAPGRTVRVLLSSGGAGGPASFAGASKANTKALRPDWTYTARMNADGTITLVKPNGKKQGTYQAPLDVSGPGPVSLAGVGTYHGTLVLSSNGSGGIQAVDDVSLDDYVRGVISAEMPATWSPEALKVQAVAARTYAITSSVGGNGFDLYPDTRSQMYGGVAAETPATDAAVAATRGQIVTYGGQPAITYFSASTGGHTENIEDAWPGSQPEPWLRGVPDPYDGAAHDPYHRWGSDMSLAAATAHLGGSVKGKLIGIRVTKHGASPRIIAAKVVGTRGSVTVSGSSLQSAFGVLTTYIEFTTITTLPGPAPRPKISGTRGFLPNLHGANDAVLALGPLVDELLAGTVPSVHGSIFPAPSSAHTVKLEVQVRHRSHWRTVAHVAVDGHGNYDAQLPHTGTYRIVYAGLIGPAVTVS